MASETFRTKVDSWLVGLIGISLIFPFLTVDLLPDTDRYQVRPFLVGIVLLTGMLFVALALTTNYVFDGPLLLVKSGPFRWHVPLAEIRAIRRTRNPLSAPAFSLDRLQIDYGRWGGVLISPKDRTGFLRALHARRPDLTLPR